MDFDDLTPEHFATPIETSGIAEVFDTTQTFDQFVTAHIESVRSTFNRNGWAQMYAHLVAGDTQWRFGPISPESIEEFRARLREEARRLDARMLFINRRTTGGLVYVSSDDEHAKAKPTSPQALQAVVDAGTARDVMFYFAHRIHLGRPTEYRHGFMDVLDGRLSQPSEGVPDVSDGYWDEILG